MIEGYYALYKVNLYKYLATSLSSPQYSWMFNKYLHLIESSASNNQMYILHNSSAISIPYINHVPLLMPPYASAYYLWNDLKGQLQYPTTLYVTIDEAWI